MEETTRNPESPGGLDRRSVLRRGALVGGALVWTVPAVQTLAGPAFAAGSPCVGDITINFQGFCFKGTINASPTCCTCVGNNGGGPDAVIKCLAAGTCQLLPPGFQPC